MAVWRCVIVLQPLVAASAVPFYQWRRQDLPTSTSNCTLVKQAFQNITTIPPSGNPILGHQNLTYCCARAVNDYFDHGCTNTNNVRVSGLTENSQWPCGAEWAHDPAGAPLVEARWEWLSPICPGWQLSAASDTTQWVQLLIGFALPAVIFTLNIPRRRTLKVPNRLFPDKIGWRQMLPSLLGAVAALVIVVADNILWLLIIFATAAPCLVSGIYEGWLDKKVLEFLASGHTLDNLPLAFKVRMLLTILTGNLDLYPAWSDTMLLASSLDGLDDMSSAQRSRRDSKQSLEVRTKAATIQNEQEVGGQLDLAAGWDGPDLTGAILFPDQVASQSAVVPDTQTAETQLTPPLTSTEDRRRKVGKVSSRLSSMLACQYGFGCTIGGPVLYYVGAFVYALVEIRQNLGDRDLAHALEFGIWFTIIPHVAIVAGGLLAGNTPFTLQGIVGAKNSHYYVGSDELLPTRTRQQSTYHQYKDKPATMRRTYPKLFERVYRAAYLPASMWNRGQCVQKWFLVLWVNSLLKYNDSDYPELDIQGALQEFLHVTAMFNPISWAYRCLAALSLIFIPVVLSLLQALFTPQVGLSCRSFTLTMYMSAQTLLLALWMLRMTWGDKYWRHARLMKKYLSVPSQKAEFWKVVKKLERLAEVDTTSSTDTRIGMINMSRRRDFDSRSGSSRYFTYEWNPVVEWTYHILLLLGLLISIFSAIGGILMEVMGVFRSEFCNVNVQNWIPSRRRNAWLMLSSNSAQAIHLAKVTWTPVGTISVVFLIIICYFGWWYQRRLRKHFEDIAKSLDGHASNGSLTSEERTVE